MMLRRIDVLQQRALLVYERPEFGSGLLTDASSRALVKVVHEFVDGDGYTWSFVVAPNGMLGWLVSRVPGGSSRLKPCE